MGLCTILVDKLALIVGYFKLCSSQGVLCLLSSWYIILLNIFFLNSVFWCIVPCSYSYVENNTPFVERWIYLLLCFCLSFFSWRPLVCMSQLSLEEPGKAPVNSRERAAFLPMKISRRCIKEGISCRWVDLVVLKILSSSFSQRVYYFKTHTCHENPL